jgi:hypothetical protein
MTAAPSGFRPWAPGGPFLSGLNELTAHGMFVTEYEEFGPAPHHLRMFGAVFVVMFVAFAAARFGAARRSVAHVAKAAVVASFLLTLWTAWSTRTLQWPREYVDHLPVVAQLLPIPSTAGDEVFVDSIPVSNFVVVRRCENDVCSLAAARSGMGGCRLTPIIASNGPMSLRGDRALGLWVFDGMSQAGPRTSRRAQLPFRESDLSCVWPGAANLRKSVRPPEDFYLWSVLFGLVALALVLFPKLEHSRVRGGLAIGAAAICWIVLHPWILP